MTTTGKSTSKLKMYTARYDPYWRDDEFLALSGGTDRMDLYLLAHSKPEAIELLERIHEEGFPESRLRVAHGDVFPFLLDEGLLEVGQVVFTFGLYRYGPVIRATSIPHPEHPDSAPMSQRRLEVLGDIVPMPVRQSSPEEMPYRAFVPRSSRPGLQTLLGGLDLGDWRTILALELALRDEGLKIEVDEDQPDRSA